MEEGGEDARLGHPGLVDDEHGAMWEPARRSRGGEEAVERDRGDPGLVREPLGSDPGGGGAEHGDLGGAERLGGGVDPGRFPDAGGPDNRDDAVAARGRSAHHALLLGGERSALSTRAQRLLETVWRYGRGAAVSAALDERERLLLEPEEVRRRVVGGPPRGRSVAHPLESGEGEQAGGERVEALDRGARACAPAQAITSAGSEKAERFSVRPSGPSIRSAARTSSPGVGSR